MKLHSQKLGDGIHIKHGFAFLGEYFADEGTYVVLTPGNFFEKGGFKSRPDKDRYYVGTFPSDYLLRQDDLIVAMTEQGPGLLGSSAIIPEDNKYLLNQRLGLLDKIDEEIFDKKYLYHLFNSRNVRGQINGSASGTKVRHTSPGRIYKVKVIVPDVISQRYISSIIENYGQLIDNNRKRIQLLEESARLLFREWFVYFCFPGYEKVKIVDGVPEGWKKEAINKVVSILGGYAFKSTAYKSDGKYGIVTIKNVQQSEFIPECTDYIDEPPTSMNAHCFLVSGDILLSLTGNVGRVCLVYGENFLLNQRVAKLVPKKSVPESYLYWLFDNSLMQSRIENLSHGAAQQNLSPIKLGNQFVIMPPTDLIKMFDDTVSLINAETITLLKQNQKLTRARDLLLPRLMNGTIEV